MTIPTATPSAIFLMGPTASGKTDAALYLAQHLPCDIISVDATQVYRGMDIGSAKPGKDILEKFPHQLVDIRDPADAYSVAQFRKDALQAIDNSIAQQRIPLLVGGSMLYFKALRDGLSTLPPSDPGVRAGVMAEAARVGWPAMHRKLSDIDPQSAARLHPNHSHRIARALEVFRMTGETLSSLQRRNGQASPFAYRLLQLGLMPEDRRWLHQRIDQRFDRMMHEGFLAEVERLYRRGDLSGHLPALRAAGYRQAWQYLEGQRPGAPLGESLTREQMVERAKIATRQLAKRQLTWLRGWPDLHPIAVPGTDPVVGASCLHAVNAFLYPGT